MSDAVDVAALVARALARRERWVDLEAGKRVCMRRPAAVQMARARGGITVEFLAAAAVGWEGMTEADLLGADGDAGKPLAFAQELWAVIVEDHADWAAKCAQQVMEMAAAHLAEREATAKN